VTSETAKKSVKIIHLSAHRSNFLPLSNINSLCFLPSPALSHTWQFIIFTFFTITGCIISYSFRISFRTQDLALQQILSSIDLFLFYRTDYTDSRTMLNGCTGKCVRLSRPLVGFWTHFKSPHFHFMSFHFISFLMWTLTKRLCLLYIKKFSVQRCHLRIIWWEKRNSFIFGIPAASQFFLIEYAIVLHLKVS